MTAPFVIRHLYDAGEEAFDARLVQSQFITAADVDRISGMGVKCVVDLTGPGEVPEADRAEAAEALAACGIERLHVPVTGAADISDACGAVADQLLEAHDTGSAVVVHCWGGTDRSVCVATAVRAFMDDRGFHEQLARMFAEFPEISPGRSTARAAASWLDRAVNAVEHPVEPKVRCPVCARRGIDAGLVGGVCDTAECTHTACPFCHDGRGTADDGCPHLVLELLDGVVRHTAFRRTGAMPFFTGMEAEPRVVAMAIHPWLATPEDPWPEGPERPPTTGVLQLLAAALAGAEVRATDIPDWAYDENLRPVAAALARAYALDPAATAREAEHHLDRLAFVMDHFGPVETGVTS